MKTLITFAALTLGNIAFAEAPFCVKTSYNSLNCWYYDADDCYKAANRADGACIPNPNMNDSSSSYSRPSNTSSAPFCVRQTYGDDCFYYSASECQRAARRSGGMCITK